MQGKFQQTIKLVNKYSKPLSEGEMYYLYYWEPTKDFLTQFITVAFTIASGKKKIIHIIHCTWGFIGITCTTSFFEIIFEHPRRKREEVKTPHLGEKMQIRQMAPLSVSIMLSACFHSKCPLGLMQMSQKDKLQLGDKTTIEMGSLARELRGLIFLTLILCFSISFF